MGKSPRRVIESRLPDIAASAAGNRTAPRLRSPRRICRRVRSILSGNGDSQTQGAIVVDTRPRAWRLRAAAKPQPSRRSARRADYEGITAELVHRTRQGAQRVICCALAGAAAFFLQRFSPRRTQGLLGRLSWACGNCDGVIDFASKPAGFPAARKIVCMLIEEKWLSSPKTRYGLSNGRATALAGSNCSPIPGAHPSAACAYWRRLATDCSATANMAARMRS